MYNKNKMKYLGLKSNDGLLEVIDVGADKCGGTMLKVTCEVCSKDTELFPEGYFMINLSNFNKGVKPCGCSTSPRWEKEQFLVRAQRDAEKKGFILHGFVGTYLGARTKLDLECKKDGHRWISTDLNHLFNGRGCPLCKVSSIKQKQKTPVDIVIRKCKEICNKMNYIFIGFTNGYSNSKSKLEYICHTHGLQLVSYDKFVNKGTRCMGCSKDLGNGNGFFPKRANEQDFLYVLNFDDRFIKVGRSFDADSRIDNLKTPSVSGIKNIIKLRIFTATHKQIWDLEQELLEELRERGFQYYVDWSTECFENDCLFILNKLLDICSFEELNLVQEK